MTAKPTTPALPAGVSDPTLFMKNMSEVMQQAANIMASQANEQRVAELTADFPVLTSTFQKVAQSYLTDPEKLINAQVKLFEQYSTLWQDSVRQMMGEAPARPKETTPDRRFRDPAWEENQVFNFLKQAYLISTRWAADLVAQNDKIDETTKQRAAFLVEQIANALSPANFAITNPEVLRVTLETNGQNLVDGMRQLAEDFAAGRGELRIRQTDLNAFEIGRNIATTPGKVVYENDIIQLIQYSPTTETVYARPLVIIPPWINKYYILDLSAEKSFIRWAVGQGLTVFVVSWVNPDERLASKTFADYMREGVLAAVQKAMEATGEPDVNAIGYCVGGTLLASTLAYMAAQGDKRINAVTFFATQVDFEKAGDLLVFIDEEQVAGLERKMADKGFLDGSKMANTFNMLRSNDLIWSYVVNNYLLGRRPAAFDLLYWNSDATRMPAALHSYYLRECYLYNNLAKGRMVLDGVQLDLSKVTVPCYNLVTREDHIAPLPSAFRVGKHLGGKTRLVVAGSGHIAGVINPPQAQKYAYWTNDEDAPDPESWLETATEHKGSWWPDWFNWIAPKSGEKVPARIPGQGRLKAIEDAPGRYVRVRSD
jgi:polyhydroxyalkanoate synthase